MLPLIVRGQQQVADDKHWLDWLAVGISIFSLAVSGLTTYRAVFFQRDDIRFVAGEGLKVTRHKNDFSLQEDQEFTFINSGNRQALIHEVFGTLVLVTNPSVQCENQFPKNIILNANPLVLKPGEIQSLHAKVVQDYPWKKENDQLRFHEDKAEPGFTYLVCIEFYITTPDSSVTDW